MEVVDFLFLRAVNGLIWECDLVFGGCEEVGGLACVWGIVWVVGTYFLDLLILALCA